MKAIRASRRRARRAGYTLVEIMIAIAVLTAFGVGIIAMQESVIHGNITARQIGTATSIARSAVEDLRLQGMGWTAPAIGAPTFVTMPLFAGVPTTATPTPSPWARFGATRPLYARDYYGQPTNIVANVEYCVQSRFTWIITNTLLRADVRVWWPRRAPQVDRAIYTDCGTVTTQDATALITQLHFVQTSTEIRYIPGPLPGGI